MCDSGKHQRGGHLLQSLTETQKQWVLTPVFCCVVGLVPGEVNKINT